MSDGYRIDPDYVDVASRIQEFYGKHENGRLVTCGHGIYETQAGPFVWCQAKAYRDPEDLQPGVGTAWEPIPGPTPFTRNSELMNAETAAWGRAIVATGIPTKKVASADEVRSRQDQPAPSKPTGNDKLSDAQMRKIMATIGELDKNNTPVPEGLKDWTDYAKSYINVQFGKKSRTQLTKAEAGKLIDQLEAQAVPF